MDKWTASCACSGKLHWGLLERFPGPEKSRSREEQVQRRAGPEKGKQREKQAYRRASLVMEPAQYEILNRVEDEHWWFVGLRELLYGLLSEGSLALPKHPRILDAGCGTGGNLRYFAERFEPAYIAGFDHSSLAIDYARSKCPEAKLSLHDICNPSFAEQAFHVEPESYDLLTCIDVIYAPGMESAMPGLMALTSMVAVGGLFVVHLPAYRWLKSAHDSAVHTSERYVVGDAIALLRQLGLQCEFVSYRLCGLLPLIALRRLPSILRRPRHKSSTDLELPAAWLNSLLLRILRAENRQLLRGHRLPFGTSLIAVGRRIHPPPSPPTLPSHT